MMTPAGVLHVRRPIRHSACRTMATTTGLTPRNAALISVLSPCAAAIQAKNTIRKTPGTTKAVPATTAPLTPCRRQPM